MTTLTIRDVPDNVRDRIRIAAAANGRSMEAEIRALLASRFGTGPSADDIARQAAKLDAIQTRITRSLPDGLPGVDAFLANRRRDTGGVD